MEISYFSILCKDIKWSKSEQIELVHLDLYTYETILKDLLRVEQQVVIEDVPVRVVILTIGLLTSRITIQIQIYKLLFQQS